jgi:hypothetical protein
MADRKQFEGVTAPSPELVTLLEKSRGKKVSEDELHEQRISFAFGNALATESITKESVLQASKKISVR